MNDCSKESRDRKGVAPLPRNWVWTTLGEIRRDESKVIAPNTMPSQWFEMYSVPSFDTGKPEIVLGKEIGSSKRIIEAGMVLLCKINPRINRVWVVRDHSPFTKIGSTEWIPFGRVEGVVPEYLCYYMRQAAFKDFLAQNVSGVGGSLMRVRVNALGSYPFPLAPRHEQHRIVAKIEELFTKLDAGIEMLRTLKAELKRYRQAVLKAAVEGKLVPTEAELARTEGRDYEPADVLLARILEERSGRWESEHPGAHYKEPEPPRVDGLFQLPEGWVWSSLDQSFKVERGRFSVRPRNDPSYYGGTYPFVQIGDLPRDGGLITGFSQTLNDAGCQVSKTFPKGTVLIAIVGATIANTGILTFESCCPDSLVAIQSDDALRLGFVELCLRSKKLEIRRSSYASGGQPNINLQTLLPHPIPLPPLAEQRRVVTEVGRRLSIADEGEKAAVQGLRQAERLRQGILRMAFEGKLVPQDPNDQPAEKLLERIRQERAQLELNGKDDSKRKRPDHATQLELM
ncbi:MAG: restriction endonuclease subunit S [Chloroflexi bacterium]|nr:restriction endonuclease subunit S [Chloroflexota bacterium]